MTDPFYAGGGIGLGKRPDTSAIGAPYPPPVVRSTDGVSGPVKSAVAALERLALAHGWTARTTYAMGHVMHGTTGAPSAEPRASLAVRMVRGTRCAVAVYAEGSASWSWTTMYYWRVDRGDLRKCATIGTFQSGLFGEVHTVTFDGWHPPWVRPWK